MKNKIAAKDRIVFPLDVTNKDEVQTLVKELTPYVKAFKIGYELGYGVGWQEATDIVMSAGGKVFLDVKLNDIPNTVAQATKALVNLKPWAINIHASAGLEAMQAMAENSGSVLTLAVTVLTAIGEDECKAIFGKSAQEQVVEFALLAQTAGIKGIICSAQEASLFATYKELNDMIIMTPGIRPSWAATNDQKRIMTPTDAIHGGVDYMVIGRPIRQAPESIGSPAQAAQAIIDEINTLNKEQYNVRFTRKN